MLKTDINLIFSNTKSLELFSSASNSSKQACQEMSSNTNYIQGVTATQVSPSTQMFFFKYYLREIGITFPSMQNGNMFALFGILM